MGYFLAVTAVRSESAQAVEEAIADYLQHHDVTYERVSGSGPILEDRDAQLFPPANGWIVVAFDPATRSG